MTIKDVYQFLAQDINGINRFYTVIKMEKAERSL